MRIATRLTLPAFAVVASVLAAASAAHAEPGGSPPVTGVGSSGSIDYAASDEDVPAEEGEVSTFTLEINPLDWFLSHWGVSAEILVARHHVLTLTGYYYDLKSAPDATFDRTNTFTGFGGEIGYRYYSSKNGPRGFYLGPSLIGGFFNVKTGGDPNANVSTTFDNIGLALDVGYQAIVADRIVIGVGAGLQYKYVTKSFPEQEWPASAEANSNVYPRVLFALGYSF